MACPEPGVLFGCPRAEACRAIRGSPANRRQDETLRPGRCSSLQKARLSGTGIHIPDSDRRVLTAGCEQVCVPRVPGDMKQLRRAGQIDLDAKAGRVGLGEHVNEHWYTTK